jgi:hypothetical protein
MGDKDIYLLLFPKFIFAEKILPFKSPLESADMRPRGYPLNVFKLKKPHSFSWTLLTIFWLSKGEVNGF